jgi:L-rhamnose mutarotase
VQRIASVIRLKEDKREEYLRLHADPWPEVMATLTRVGVRNYSIFLHGDLLFSYLEFSGESWEDAQAEIARDPDTRRWWTLTDPCQTPVEGALDSEWWSAMRPVFLLE